MPNMHKAPFTSLVPLQKKKNYFIIQKRKVINFLLQVLLPLHYSGSLGSCNRDHLVHKTQRFYAPSLVQKCAILCPGAKTREGKRKPHRLKRRGKIRYP